VKRKWILTLLALTALLLSGCAMRTVEEMYALPKRAEEYTQLQAAIDLAMAGKTFSAPLYGENQQTVQMADLDGDGVEEYLIFASDNSDKQLKVLIVAQTADGTCRLVDTIESNGAAFEQVEYVQFDNRPGCELIIGRQVSDQVLRSVSVYTYEGGSAEQLLLIGYSKFLTCDLNQDGRSELMVLRPGEAQSKQGMAVLYSSRNGQVERSVETELSEDPSNIRRITSGTLQCGTPAVFVASSVNGGAIVTDIFTIREDRFANITLSAEGNTSIRTLRNYYVYAEDIDADGILELPGMITMKPIGQWLENDQNFLLRWYSMDADGWEMDKRYTFHNFVGGWYMQIDSALATRITVDQHGGTFYFYVWEEDQPKLLFTVYVLTDSNRDEQAVENGRFALHRTESAAYAAKLERVAADYGITEESLKSDFHMIRQVWRTGET